MKNIVPAIMTVLAIGLSAMYFTTAEPTADATQTGNDAIGAVLVNIVRRLDVVEKKLKIKVPEDQVIGITNEVPKP